MNCKLYQDAESIHVFVLSVGFLCPSASEILASSHGSRGVGGDGGKGQRETCQDTNCLEVKLLSKYPASEFVITCSHPGSFLHSL